jgi:hypothetical protein
VGKRIRRENMIISSQHRRQMDVMIYTPCSLKLAKKKQKSDTNTGERTNKKIYPVGLPYIAGLSENLQRLLSNHEHIPQTIKYHKIIARETQQ